MPYIPPTKDATPIPFSSILPTTTTTDSTSPTTTTNTSDSPPISTTQPTSPPPNSNPTTKAKFNHLPNYPYAAATIDDLLTPTALPAIGTMSTFDSAPSVPASRVDALSEVLASTSLSPAPASPPVEASAPVTIPTSSLHTSITGDDLPGLSTSSSSTSIASDSLSEGQHARRESASSQSSNSEPDITAYQGADSAAYDPVMRYRVDLYNYTKNLYMEAKIAAKREQRKRELAEELGGYGAFGRKTSGMERMAAKKALARRLRD